eukprot:1609653-Pleurochrysis_carterae.AAC.1
MMYQPGSTPGSAAGSNPGSPASTSRKNKLQRCSICGQLGARVSGGARGCSARARGCSGPESCQRH